MFKPNGGDKSKQGCQIKNIESCQPPLKKVPNSQKSCQISALHQHKHNNAQTKDTGPHQMLSFEFLSKKQFD